MHAEEITRLSDMSVSGRSRICAREREDFTPTAGTSSSKDMQADTYIFDEDDELEDLLPNVEHPSLGFLIGAETKQLLFIGVKEKFCYTCVAAGKKKKDVTDHLCFFNYQGPSTGMEQDIILEGFCASIKQHG
uniref:Mutator-like transposase domain-containing protein n=1 Tax=Timema poppense TaxID=170557 RepID=A0A7R9DQM6_TIMPO|nr:unnamed protein product [Timema poppensis]